MLDVLHGIPLGTIRLSSVRGMKLDLKRISTPRPEDAELLQTLRMTLPRPKTRLDRVDLTLTEGQAPFESRQSW